MHSPVSVCLQRSGKLQLLSLWCCLLIKAGNELSHIHLCRSPHEREKGMERGLEATEEVLQERGTLCAHEGEKGCLNYFTCLLFHSTAAPLGYSLFTLLCKPLCSVRSRNWMMGKQKTSWDNSGCSRKGCGRGRGGDRDRMRLLKATQEKG